MDNELAEIRKIRQETEDLGKLINSYYKKNEYLKERQAKLFEKIIRMEPKEFNWTELMEDCKQPEGYMVCEIIQEISKDYLDTPERRRQNIIKLREEVLKKQYENMKLEKQLTDRKQEEVRILENIAMRKEALRKEAQRQTEDEPCPECLKHSYKFEEQEEIRDEDKLSQKNNIWLMGNSSRRFPW